MIKITDLSKVYKVGDIETYALKNVELTIDQGEIVVLLGPSGSGKSTLLNLMSGLDKPTSGEVQIEDTILSNLTVKELTRFRRENSGFIFQQYNLLPSLTVEENIHLGKQLSSDTYELNDILSFVSLEKHINKYPFQLSGGEQQRVSIARAIIKKPSILFCDEPTGALDEKTSKDVLSLIQKLNKEYKTTIVLITHNPFIALIADKVITLNSGNIIDIKTQKRQKAEDISWS